MGTHTIYVGDVVLTKNAAWREQARTIYDWSAWIAEPDQVEQLEVLGRHVERGLPCGAEEFVHGRELRLGHEQRPTLVGRPKTIDHDSVP